jgi:PKHD-type hydroxylase
MICISDTINQADLASINFLIDDKNNQDGRITAGHSAKKVKHNLQQFSGEALNYAENLIKKFCHHSPIVQNYAFPKAYSAMRIIRYQEGMYYGKHIDNVLNGTIRTDISFTVFLSEPDNYQGGILRLYNNNHATDIKLPAGSMVLYPSDSLHEITPVTSGERVVLVGWIQSTIQDPLMRAILSDLANARNIMQETDTEMIAYEKIMHAFNRLYRLNACV